MMLIGHIEKVEFAFEIKQFFYGHLVTREKQNLLQPYFAV